MPTTGDRIIQEMEFRYSSVGDKEVQARVNALIKIYEKLRTAASTLMNPNVGEAQQKGARTAIANANEQLRLMKTQLTATEAIRKGNLAIAQRESDAEVARITRQRAFAKQSEQEIAREREKNYRGLTQQIQKEQAMAAQKAASNMAMIQKESDAEVARINRQRKYAKQTEKEIATERQQNYRNLVGQLTTAEQLANRPDIAGQRAQLARERFTGEANRKIYASLTPGETFQYYMNRFGNVFRRVTDALLSFLVINTVSNAIRGFLSSVIESNKQLELLDSRLGGLTGISGSLSELRATIIDLTVRTPFILKDFLEASVTLTAFGINARKNLLPVANWAAAVGRNVEDVALAFAKVVTGSPRTALLLSTRGISKAEFDKEKAKTLDATKALVNIIERQFGDMALRVSKTFAGLLSNIKDVWFLISAAIGKDVFQAIRTDLQAIYDLLIKTAQGGSTLGNILTGTLSKALWGIYTTLKVSLVPILVTLAVLGGKNLYIFFKGALDILDKLKMGLGSFVGKAQGWLTFFLVAITAYKTYEAAIKRVNAAMIEFKKGGEEGSQILIDRVQELRDSLRNVNGAASFMRDIFEKLPKSFQNVALTIARLIPGTGQEFIELIVNNRIADSLDKIAEKEQKLKNTLDALRKSMEEFGAIKDAFDFRQELEGMEGAIEAWQLLVSKVPGYRAQLIRDLDKAATTGKEDESLVIVRQLNVLYQLEEFAKKMGLTREQAQKAAFENFKSEAGNFLEYISKETKEPLKDIQDRFRDSFFKKEKTGKSSIVELKDYTTELNTALERYAALLGGAERDEAKLVGLEAKASGLMKEWFALRAKSILTNKEVNRMREIEVQYNETLIGQEETRQRIADQRYNLAARNFELEQNLIKKQTENRRAELEFIYEQTGEGEEYRRYLDRLRGDLEDQLDNTRFKLEYERKLQSTRREGSDDWLQIQANILKYSQDEADIVGQILAIRRDIYGLPSPTFFEALQKQAASLKRELEGFYDDLASTVVGGVREFGVGMVNSLLFGDDTENNDERIADLRGQLDDLYRQQRNESNVWQVIRRQEDESAESYLERIRLAEAEYQKQTQIYEYQTKELEILNEINRLESERNNLILQRLQQLGEKVFDTLLNQIIGMAVKAVLPGATAITTGGTGGTGTGGGGTGPHDRTVIQFNGPVYGTRDFDMAIDNAMARISSKRGY